MAEAQRVILPEPEQEKSGLPYNPDDDRLATALANEWKGKVSYFHSSWRVYEAGSWAEREHHQVRGNIRAFLRQHRDNLPRGVSQARISALAAMLEDDCFISDRRIIEMQQHSEKYINLVNGLFNLETFELEPHNPDLYLTTQMDFAYDKEATCPTFKKFLRTSLATPEGQDDDKMILLAQEALAYSMTARTDFKASFWLIGEPDTGKSTLIGLIRSLMGNLHSTIDLNQLEKNRFLLAGIVGKRVVTFTEADSTAMLPDALYKAIVGGQDEIQVDVKNRDPITFVPTAKFWWAMNNAPRINDRSGATLNRLLPILFQHRISPAERDPELPSKLVEEKPGIFNYLLLGWQRLIKLGSFTQPTRSKAWREEFRIENDTEFMFAQERLEFNNDYRLNGKELYSDYRGWCEDSGFRPKSLSQIGKEWRRLGLELHHTDGRSIWKGARIRNK